MGACYDQDGKYRQFYLLSCSKGQVAGKQYLQEIKGFNTIA